MWNNTGPNLIYFSTSSCLSLGQIELTKYLQFSFTLASSNSEWGKKENLKIVSQEIIVIYVWILFDPIYV
jgi:hypothetical protein